MSDTLKATPIPLEPVAPTKVPELDIWSDIMLRLNAMETMQGGRTGPSIQLRDLLTQIRESPISAQPPSLDAVDAARYRWLRDNHGWWLLKHFPATRPYVDAIEVFDDAIDTAMGEAP